MLTPSPQGVALACGAGVRGARVDGRALYFVIDESDMIGGQLALSAPLAPDVKAGFTGSYYHYRLGSVAGADAGDFRGNLLSGGRYLSDFHLLEGMATLIWTGLSPRWPLGFTADDVRNLGAAGRSVILRLSNKVGRFGRSCMVCCRVARQRCRLSMRADASARMT